jgi:hypothetical protein
MRSAFAVANVSRIGDGHGQDFRDDGTRSAEELGLNLFCIELSREPRWMIGRVPRFSRGCLASLGCRAEGLSFRLVGGNAPKFGGFHHVLSGNGDRTCATQGFSYLKHCATRSTKSLERWPWIGPKVWGILLGVRIPRKRVPVDAGVFRMDASIAVHPRVDLNAINEVAAPLLQSSSEG